MAERTPRVMWQNLVQLSGTTVAVSSVEAAFPKNWMKDPQVTKAWRSKVGWNVVAGVNDKLDFTEAGNVRVATVTAGNYATGAAMATAVQTALNAAVGITNTYTCTYSAVTFKFTIARATGADAVVLTWLTGANTLTTVGPDLGFDITANDTGGTSYVGDNVAHHSREWAKFDLQSALPASVGIVAGHVPLAVGGVIRVQGNATDVWTAPTINLALTGDDRIQVNFPGAEVSLRYWRVFVDDVQNTRGYSQIAVPYVGTYFQPARSVLVGYTENSDDLSVIVEADQGAVFQNKKPRRKRWNLSFPRLQVTDKNAFDAMQDYLGIGRSCFLALDPQNSPGETRYGFFNQAFTETQSVGDGTPPDRWTIGVSFVETVG